MDDKTNSVTVGIKKMKKDSAYTKLKSIIETTPFDVEKYTEEMLHIHATRFTRKVKRKNGGSSKRLIDASIKEGLYRSRLVEMVITCRTAMSNLDSGYDATQIILMAHYGKYLASVRTKEEKLNMVGSLPAMSKACSLINQMTTFIENCQDVIKDIDQLGFGLKLQGEQIALITHNRTI